MAGLLTGKAPLKARKNQPSVGILPGVARLLERAAKLPRASAHPVCVPPGPYPGSVRAGCVTEPFRDNQLSFPVVICRDARCSLPVPQAILQLGARGPFLSSVHAAALKQEFPDHSPSGIVSLLRNVLRDPEYAPPVLPAVALKLVEVSRDPDVELSKVRELMEADPLITAKVMSIAQSTFYTRGTPVESIEDALVRLGVKRLTGIFLEASMRATVLQSRAFEAPMEKVRKHSTATAHIARGICRSLQQPGERAFVCALLHDIGIAGCLGVIGSLSRKERPTDPESIAKAVTTVHEEASAIIGEKWSLPWGMQWVIGHHHDYWVDGRVSPLAALVCMSDWLATEAGAGALDEVNEEQAQKALAYFGFDGAAHAKLLDKCRRIVDELP